ncbi:MAG TPA: GGDEF domain-containing protein [Gaiellaceae bacterium]|nr:GGDEF domain-containing protein [Gaiellaceae bacterium]
MSAPRTSTGSASTCTGTRSASPSPSPSSRRAEAKLRALEERASIDALTKLSNAQALQDELDRHAATFPLGVLVLDFDGLREANAAFGYTDGGDVLIRAVGSALARLAKPTEFAARMHTAGDEFALLVPGADEAATSRRAQEVEAALDALHVSAPLDEIYRGASVGFAQRRADESPGQCLGRAVESMRERKRQRSVKASP